MDNSFINQLFLTGEQSNFTIVQIIVLIVFSFLIGIAIAKTYQKTHNTFSYSASFVNTLIILCMVTTIIILAIKNSPARAFALVGALSIIRFRTAVKNTKDTAFVFWTVAEGLALGANEVVIAGLGLVLISAGVWFLAKINFGVYKTFDYLLKFRLKSDNNEDAYKLVNKIFDKYLQEAVLVNMHHIDKENAADLIYNIHFKKIKDLQKFLDEIIAVPEVSKANIISEKNSARH